MDVLAADNFRAVERISKARTNSARPRGTERDPDRIGLAFVGAERLCCNNREALPQNMRRKVRLAPILRQGHPDVYTENLIRA